MGYIVVGAVFQLELVVGISSLEIVVGRKEVTPVDADSMPWREIDSDALLCWQ
jgi:hypothetical protein